MITSIQTSAINTENPGVDSLVPECSRPIVALTGNPNVGKSTVFNGLTRLKQHTGNWPGKTVTYAKGICCHEGLSFTIVDLPGTYSLVPNSAEEEVARDFLCFAQPDVTVIVVDGTCLERNLNLVLQVLEVTPRIVLCVNLMDEAMKKKISINLEVLSDRLGIPVIGTNARKKQGLDRLMDAVHKLTVHGNSSPVSPVKYDNAVEEAISIIEPVISHCIQGIDTNSMSDPDCSPQSTSAQPSIRSSPQPSLRSSARTSPMGNARWVSVRILEGELGILKGVGKHISELSPEYEALLQARKKALGILEKAGIETGKLADRIVAAIVNTAEEIFKETVYIGNRGYDRFDRMMDSILASRLYGIPVMLGLLGLVFWLTIKGANYPSSLLAKLFSYIGGHLSRMLADLGSPEWLHRILVEGIYGTMTSVVAVMLPPMAIFFPLFTLLEDVGYLPRVAFNLDSFFKKACANGKQSLTMCMGFGCNVVGVMGCRIIDSPRERLIAILTNCFIPCNGRFPLLVALSSVFLGGSMFSGLYGSIFPVIAVMGIILAGTAMTLAVSWLLSRTVLKGMPSSFTLELPPYRKPQIGNIIVRSILDRTIFVLLRAVVIAAPAGLIIWLMANITAGSVSILDHCAAFLHPVAKIAGMDGYILTAFILAFPANEIVLPIIIMSYTAAGTMVELDSLSALYQLLSANSWTWVTALCVMLFSLMHFPCGTTLWTIRKETGSICWTLASLVIPLLAGMGCCIILAQAARLLGLQ